MGAKFRIYPESRGEAVFREWCGQERFLINMAVEQYDFASRYRAFAANPTVAVKSRQHWPSNAERNRQLTELRSTPEMEWLAAGSRKVQTQALRLTDRAYQNWFHNPTHFRRPKFRSKHDILGFSLVGRKPGESGGDWGLLKINRRWAEVRLPKIGWTKFRLTVPWTRIADARSCRVTLDRAGRWHISFPGPQPEVFRTQTGAVAGVDRGVANTVAISDTDATGGGVEDGMGHAPGLSPKEAERVLRLERKLARQKKDSKRRELTRLRKAKVMARLVDRRRDWVEKNTTWLVQNYDIIFVERLDVRAMTKAVEPRPDPDCPGRYLHNGAAAKTGLNRAILAQCWGLWLTRLKEKASTCGVLVVEVSAYNTSRRCAACGHTEQNNRESQAVFICRSCGHLAHADSNAAVNIRDRGMAMLAGGSPVTAQGDSGLPGSSNCEAPVLAA